MRKTRRLPGLKLFALLFVPPLLACLLQCSTKATVSSEHCGGVACSGVNTCQAAANVPLCADPFSAACHSVSHECTYKLKTDSACPCLEHDVRLCMVNTSTPGVQICTANAGRTATSWAACVACPGCT